MSRLARVVLPGIPHHITQRGVRSMEIFRGDVDRLEYLRLLRYNGLKHGLRFMAYCLMSNHVHVVAVPQREDSLAKTFGETHKAFTRAINARLGVKGYLFQGRFYSCPMDDRHTIVASAYTERNPVRAGMVGEPWKYFWSSARFHVGLSKNDPLVDGGFAMAPCEWRVFLMEGQEDLDKMRANFRSGRPLGTLDFEIKAERIAGRRLRPLQPGRKKREIGVMSPITA